MILFLSPILSNISLSWVISWVSLFVTHPLAFILLDLSILLILLSIYFPLKGSISSSLFLPFLPPISQTLNSFSLYSPLLLSFFLHNLDFFNYAFHYSLYFEIIGLLKSSSIHKKSPPLLVNSKSWPPKHSLLLSYQPSKLVLLCPRIPVDWSRKLYAFIISIRF